MVLVADTRFLIAYFFPPSEEARQELAACMAEALAEGLVLPTVTVAEFVKVAGPKLGLDGVRARLAALVANGARIEPLTYENAIAAGSPLLRITAPFADACITALALCLGARGLSDDPHYSALGARTVWPLRSRFLPGVRTACW